MTLADFMFHASWFGFNWCSIGFVMISRSPWFAALPLHGPHQSPPHDLILYILHLIRVFILSVPIYLSVTFSSGDFLIGRTRTYWRGV